MQVIGEFLGAGRPLPFKKQTNMIVFSSEGKLRYFPIAGKEVARAFNLLLLTFLLKQLTFS
jgi:hypothetical protein